LFYDKYRLDRNQNEHVKVGHSLNIQWRRRWW